MILLQARSEENMEMNDTAIVETAIVAKSKSVGTKVTFYTVWAEN